MLVLTLFGQGHAKDVCFESRDDLVVAVEDFLVDGDASLSVAEYGPISSWCFSVEITDFSYLFANATFFNEELNKWDVSNIETMEGMFEGAVSFNGDITSWDVENCKNTRWMFRNAVSFNQDISNWRLFDNVNMDEMFRGASRFVQDLCSWGSNFKHAPGEHIFEDTACPLTTDPEMIGQMLIGPLCYECIVVEEDIQEELTISVMKSSHYRLLLFILAIVGGALYLRHRHLNSMGIDPDNHKLDEFETLQMDGA